MQNNLPEEITESLHKLELAEGAEKIDILNSLAHYYLDKDSSRSIQYSESASQHSNSIKDDGRMANSILLQGVSRFLSNDIITALELFSTASIIFEKAGDTEKHSEVLLRIGRCQTFLGDNNGAMETQLKALKLSQSISSIKLESWAYMELGLSCWSNKDNKLALEYMNKSYELRNKHEDKRDLAAITGNLGNVYISLNDYKTAYYYFEKCLGIFKELDDHEGMGRAYINMGICLWGLEKFDDALELVNENLSLFYDLDNKEVITEAYSTLGSIYTDKNDFAKAQVYLDKALNTAKEYHLNYKFENLYEGKSRCAYLSGDYKTAYDFSLKHHEASNKRIQHASEVKAKYLTTMHEVDSLRSESEILSAKNSELSELNEALKSKSLEVERVNTINTKLLSILAHDLKNPLWTIQQVAEIQIAEPLPPEDVVEVFRELKSSANASLSMLDEVLQWGTLQVEGKNAASFSDFNFYELIEKQKEDYKLLLKSKNNRIENLVSENFTFKADINMIRFIIRNLIMNANKFMHNGVISISASDNKEHTRITVSDTGIGMKPSQVERLFDWDKRQSTDGTSGEKGTGLGLLICNEFVQNHRGEIKVESEPGKGSSFHFTISKYL
ncbi:MAG: tetratricopeptide repeat-containing sensor histidine kinase [Bacteroidetes bacterium]|nr:tetratricopeptide repeat-containing sensor histidine kinase [Bacteroidota bacterium]